MVKRLPFDTPVVIGFFTSSRFGRDYCGLLVRRSSAPLASPQTDELLALTAPLAVWIRSLPLPLGRHCSLPQYGRDFLVILLPQPIGSLPSAKDLRTRVGSWIALGSCRRTGKVVTGVSLDATEPSNLFGWPDPATSLESSKRHERAIDDLKAKSTSADGVRSSALLYQHLHFLQESQF